MTNLSEILVFSTADRRQSKDKRVSNVCQSRTSLNVRFDKWMSSFGCCAMHHGKLNLA